MCKNDKKNMEKSWLSSDASYLKFYNSLANPNCRNHAKNYKNHLFVHEDHAITLLKSNCSTPFNGQDTACATNCPCYVWGIFASFGYTILKQQFVCDLK